MAAVCTPLTHARLSGTYLGGLPAPAARFSGAGRDLWAIGPVCGASAALRRTRGTPLQGPACATSTMSRCRHPSPALPVPVQALPVPLDGAASMLGARGEGLCLAAHRAGGRQIFSCIASSVGAVRPVTDCMHTDPSKREPCSHKCTATGLVLHRNESWPGPCIKLLPLRRAAVAALPRRPARPAYGPPAGAKMPQKQLLGSDSSS